MKPLLEWIEPIFADPPPDRVLFRVDAGRIYGLSFGHLVRCLILSRQLHGVFGSQTLFLMRAVAEGLAYARRCGAAVESLAAELSPGEQARALRQAVESFRPDWVILDLPYPDQDTDAIASLQGRGVRVFWLDDFRFQNPGADVYHNSSVIAADKMCFSAGDRTRYLLGPHYFISDLSAEGPRVRSRGLLNVLLSFGGSDPTGITLAAAGELLRHEWPHTVFRIVAGPGYGETGLLRGLLKRPGFELVVQPEDIYPYFRGCDLAVCAGGRTLYELLQLNKTVLPVASTPLEAETVTACQRKGMVSCVLERWEPQRFADGMRQLWQQKHELRHGSRRRP